MSSRHLPIVIGENKTQRVVIVHLLDEAEKRIQDPYEEKRVVITTPDSGNTPLFKIYRDALIVDRYVNDNAVPENYTAKPRNKWSEHSWLSVSINGNLLEPVKQAGNYDCFYADEVFDGIVEFVYQEYNKKKKSYSEFKGRLHIVRPHPEDPMLKINADLGSDATQVSYSLKTKKSDGTVSKVNIVEELKKAYKKPQKEEDVLSGHVYRAYEAKKEGVKEPMFIQEEKESPNFYKTGQIRFQNGGKITVPITHQDSFINYLTVSAAGKNHNYSTSCTETEDKFDRLLVNIKMLYAESGRAEDDRIIKDIVDFGYQGEDEDLHLLKEQDNLVEILRVIYQQLIEITTRMPKFNRCKYVSVLLLVPNIYSQYHIDHLLYHLNSKMNPQYGAENGSSKLYDFRVISESDSAFVGLVEKRGNNECLLVESLRLNEIDDIRKKDVFLVIDAGKGTTDFSIIRYEGNNGGTANNLISSEARGGIVGAGGAIDYVFARVLARQIYGYKEEFFDKDLKEKGCVEEKVFVDNFMNMIQSLRPRYQDWMMLVVETLKKSYNVESGSVFALYKCFTEVDEAAGDGVTKEDIENKKQDKKSIINYLLKKDCKPETIANESFSGALDAVLEFKYYNVKDKVKISDVDKKEVEMVCTAIANGIMEQVFVPGNETLVQETDYVIFTGRCFLFKPLVKAFKDVIKNSGKRAAYQVNSTVAGRRGQTENLTVADLPKLDREMKSISVEFTEHNMGVNCNSDLCCLDGLTSPNYDNATMRLERFWTGFRGTEKQKKIQFFYIGYQNTSFTNGEPMRGMHHAASATLVNMTLFPFVYKEVHHGQKQDEQDTIQQPTPPEPNGNPPIGDIEHPEEMN